MKEEVISRLASLGYQIDDIDDNVLDDTIVRVELHIRTYCNIVEIPPELNPVIVDRVCAEVLTLSHNGNSAVKSARIGDVDITFDEDKIPTQMLIEHLQRSGEEALVCYKKMKW